MPRTIQWIIDFSESDRHLQHRFSLSPTANGFESASKESQAASANGQGSRHSGSDESAASTISSSRTQQATESATGSNRAPVGEVPREGSKPKPPGTTPETPGMSILKRREQAARGDTASSPGVISPSLAQHGEGDDHILPVDLMQQVRYLQLLLHYPRNTDIVFSYHYTGDGAKCAIVYSNVSVSKQNLEENLLRPLHALQTGPNPERVIAHELPCSGFHRDNHPDALAIAVVEGNVVLLLANASAFVYTYTDFPTRPVSLPQNESVLRGAQEAFTESIETNMAIMRRIVRCPDVLFEEVTLKDPARSRLAVCSIAGLTNQRLLNEVHRRVDNIGQTPIILPGLIEQHLEDHWRSLFPTVVYTERPDLTTRYLTEGYVVVLIDNLPLALVVPGTLWMQFQTAEDMNLRVWYANFLRIIRFIALIDALLLPAIYIALTNFQQEMIPSDILMAMSAARQNMPFPTIVEVLILEISFELIREASIRVPQAIGSTIGIVGALILGQAAVDANLVSPVVVIIVAMTGLSSFAIPNQSISFAIRIHRYVFTLSSFLFGFFGIGIVVSLLIGYLSSMQSFGVPYLSPLAPFRKKEEGFLHKSVLSYDSRPISIHPQGVTNSQLHADLFAEGEDDA